MSANTGALALKFWVPLRLGRGQNERDGHWGQRAARVRRERQAVRLGWVGNGLSGIFARPPLHPLPFPCAATITRVAPAQTKQLDAHENLPGACKAVVDEVAAILGVDDADPRVTWRYAQERGPWGVWVHIVAQLAAPEVVPAPRQHRPKKPRLLKRAQAQAGFKVAPNFIPARTP